MYVYLNDLFSILPGVASLLWLFTGGMAGRLSYRSTERRARRTLIMVGVSSLFSLLVLVAIGLTVTVGWDIAEPKVVVMAPQLLVPLVFVFAASVPRLLASTRAKPASFTWLVVPIQTTAMGALEATYYDLLRRPDTFGIEGVLEFWAPIAVVAAVLVLRQRRRRAPRRRLLRLGVSTVVVAA
ncbi:MAG TPA: hypothetical protein VHZ97_23515, partial [Pseudonocardiaceae bacterium]|nr:hypothetical protein [Pseudonocardiaceae bacterium]